MSDDTQMNEEKQQEDFPSSSPGFLSKIPKPVLFGGIAVIVLLLLFSTFPRGNKKDEGKTVAEQSSVMDDYEQQNPIETDPFATQSKVGSDEHSTAVARSASLGRTYDRNGDPAQAPAMLDQATPRTYRNPSQSLEGNLKPVQHNGSKPTSSDFAPEPVAYSLPRSIANRLDNKYQSMVQHFKQTPQFAVVTVREDEYEELLKSADRLDKVEPPLRNLTENAERYANGVTFTVPAGTRIRAVTQQEVNSDHPGFFTARISSPMELSGYTLLCRSRSNTRDRIPVSADKIIAPDGSRETTIPGEVQMKYAGLEGKVKSHHFKRLVPPVASAFVGAGAGYLYFRAIGGHELNSEAGRINTADAVIGPPYQEGVSGVQSEISRMGGDYPNTVTVPQGTQFELLVTEAFTIDL